MRVGRRKQFAHGQHIRGDDAAEAKAEHGRDGEEPGLALGRQETDHSYELANGAGKDVQGVSTRSVDDLVKAMGMAGISKSQVSRLCAEIVNDDSAAFNDVHIWPFLRFRGN